MLKSKILILLGHLEWFIYQLGFCSAAHNKNLKTWRNSGFNKLEMYFFTYESRTDIAVLPISFACLTWLELPCSCKRNGPPTKSHLPFWKEERASQGQKQQASFQRVLPETQGISSAFHRPRLSHISILNCEWGWKHSATFSPPKSRLY